MGYAHETALLTGPVPDCNATVQRGMTENMRRALMVAVGGDGVQWDAEDSLGIQGAAFWNTLDALRSRELVDSDYCLTDLGRSVRRLIRNAAREQRIYPSTIEPPLGVPE